MTVHAVVPGLSTLAVLAVHGNQGRGVSAETPGRQLEDLPLDGRHRARYHRQGRWLVKGRCVHLTLRLP
jgi:hypothetical protein